MNYGPFLLRFFKWHMNTKSKPRPAPDGYESKLDVDALGDGIFSHQFDILYAKKENRLNKVVIDIHGGSYFFNTRKFNFAYAEIFLKEGYDVILLDYPQNNGKRGVIDQIRILAKQISFLMEHAKEYSLNKDEFQLTGDSAGGHHALILAEASNDLELCKKLEIDLNGFKPKSIFLSCPVYDYAETVRQAYFTKRGKKYVFGPKTLQEGHNDLISPRTYIKSLNIPLFLNTCKNDFIGLNSTLLHQDLEQLNYPHTYIYLDTDNKEVDHVHNIIKLEQKESIDVNNKILEFLKDK